MSRPVPIDPDLLRHNTAWVRAMARSLVRDDTWAEDVAQETWLAALQSELRPRNVRAWLLTVMRNVVNKSARGERRRVRRERATARPEAQAAETDVLERASVHRRIVEFVTELDEPFRTALLLRYFDDLTPPEIARKLEVPLDTVRSRLRRGLARMRERLDVEHDGDRTAWLSALVPLFGRVDTGAPPLGTGAALLTTMAMPTKVKLLVAGAAFLAGGVLLVPRLLEPVSDRPLSESVETPSSVLTEPLELSASKPSPSTIGESREVVDADDSAAAATEPAAASHSVRGLVIGPDTHPVGDVDLRWTPEGDGAALPVTCDARGRFEFECEAQRGVIESADERYATILAGRFRVNGSEAVVVVGRRIALSGRVRDYAGQELAGARVSYELPKGFARRFPQVLDASLEQTFVATADEDGGFEFTRLPAVEGSQLITSQPGYSDDERAAPSFETHGLDVVLASRDASRRSVRGIVIDPSGSPVPGAWVSAGAWEDTTDDRGEFLFDAPIAAQAKEIVAVHAGYLPARAQGMPDGEVSLWPAFVTLQFKGTPLTLEGLVVNDVGNPVAGARVWLDDPTRFAIRPSGPVLVENVLSAARTTDEIMEAGEDVQATPNSIWSWVTTDDNGHFRIEGLVARDYRLAAMDMETLVTTRRAGVAAGSVGVKLVLPTQNGTRAIAGRVLTETGVPIVDAGVMIQCAPYRISGFTWTVLGPKTRSDADGRFMLPVCPSEGELYVYAPEFVSSKLDLTLIEEGRDVEVRLAGHGGDSHFRVVLDDPSFADRVVLYDEEEMPVHLTIVRGGARYGRQDAQIVDGESYTFLLREGTYEVVFYRAGVEVGRRWEVFVSGEVHTLGRR